MLQDIEHVHTRKHKALRETICASCHRLRRLMSIDASQRRAPQREVPAARRVSFLGEHGWKQAASPNASAEEPGDDTARAGQGARGRDGPPDGGIPSRSRAGRRSSLDNVLSRWLASPVADAPGGLAWTVPMRWTMPTATARTSATASWSMIVASTRRQVSSGPPVGSPAPYGGGSLATQEPSICAPKPDADRARERRLGARLPRSVGGGMYGCPPRCREWARRLGPIASRLG